MERPVGGRRELKVVEKLRRSLGGPETVMSSMMAVQDTFESATERTRSGWRPRQKSKSTFLLGAGLGGNHGSNLALTNNKKLRWSVISPVS
jgi:hypothetical protein